MGADERRIAIRADHPYAANVRKGYPVLKELGSDLARRGVHFVDLTNLFANTSEALYRDNCCHVNINGLRLVSAAIAKAIASDLESFFFFFFFFFFFLKKIPNVLTKDQVRDARRTSRSSRMDRRLGSPPAINRRMRQGQRTAAGRPSGRPRARRP